MPDKTPYQRAYEIIVKICNENTRQYHNQVPAFAEKDKIIHELEKHKELQVSHLDNFLSAMFRLGDIGIIKPRGFNKEIIIPLEPRTRKF